MIAIVIMFASFQSATADWRQEVGNFRIVVVGDDASPDALAKLEPFRLAIQSQLGIPTQIKIETGLERFISSQSDRPYEYLVLPSSAYAVIWTKCECIEPLAIARTADGQTAMRGVLIKKAQASATINDLANKEVLALSESSIAGYAMPDQAIRSVANGNSPNWQFEESAEKALSRFLEEKASAIAGWIPADGDPQEHKIGTLARLKQLSGKDDAYQIVWQSGKIPNRVHAVNKMLNSEAKQLLRGLIQSIDSKDPVAYDALELDFAGGYEMARHHMFVDLVSFFNKQNDGDGLQ